MSPVYCNDKSVFRTSDLFARVGDIKASDVVNHVSVNDTTGSGVNEIRGEILDNTLLVYTCIYIKPIEGKCSM